MCLTIAAANDLAVGVSDEQFLIGKAKAGIVYILLGTDTDGLVARPSDRLRHNLAVGEPTNHRDRFGYALSTAHVDGNGLDKYT